MAQNVVPIRPTIPILNFHPLAKILPLMEGTEYEDLVASIRVHGQRDPIIVAEGMILDGRNRYRACVDCNRPPEIKDLTEVAGADADPRQYVIDKNLLRRHLTESQRAAYMCQYATYQRGDAESQRLEKAKKNHDANRDGSSELTTAEAAAMAQVSERTIQHAKVVFTDGTEEEKKAILDGSMPVKTAARRVRAPVSRVRNTPRSVPREAA